MKIIDRTITNIIDNEYLEYSMYVLEQRAIPSCIDGFKSVGRKLVHAMLTEHGGRKVKLSDASGISKYNYHHGESSAAGASVTLTADWNNNCPVFTGHGNFGSRLIQEAAASRYIYISVSPEFKKYFIDTDIAPKSFDSENPEPAFYLPTIPWVLVNGISGIAVGFATNVLPRSVSDITASVKKYLKDPKKFLSANAKIKPTFPHFRGQVVADEVDQNKWLSQGIIEYVGKYTYKITELPVGYDRETYVNLLNDLLDSDKIKDYDDDCSEAGFGFTIKVTTAQKEKIDSDPLKYFKLTKSHNENLTTLGTDGKLKIFSSVSELIAYFCDYRISMFEKKIEFEKTNLAEDIKVLQHKVKWIDLVARGKVNFKKLDKQGLLQCIHEQVTEEEYGKKFINIPLYSCTQEEISTLETKIVEMKEQLRVLCQTTPMIRYLSVL